MNCQYWEEVRLIRKANWNNAVRAALIAKLETNKNIRMRHKSSCPSCAAYGDACIDHHEGND